MSYHNPPSVPFSNYFSLCIQMSIKWYWTYFQYHWKEFFSLYFFFNFSPYWFLVLKSSSSFRKCSGYMNVIYDTAGTTTWRRKEISKISRELGFSGGSLGEEAGNNAGDVGSMPGSGISPGGGPGNPSPHSCLENAKDRGAWRAAVHRAAKSQKRLKWLSMHAEAILEFRSSHPIITQNKF